MSPLIRRIVAAAAGLALAFSAGGLAAAGPAAHSVSWRTAWRGPRDGEVLGITAPSRKSAWAIGETYSNDHGRPFLVRWNGRRWHESGMPVKGYQPAAIASSSPDDVWMFGASASGTPEALSWNGHQWITVLEPPAATAALTGADVLGPADVWIAMQGSVFHDLGGIWSTSHLPSGLNTFDGGSLGGFGGTSDRNMWAVGISSDGTGSSTGLVLAYRWTGSTWQRVRMPRLVAYASSILAESRTNIWIVGNDKALHWNGSRWRKISNEDEPAVGPLAPFGTRGLWVSAYELWTGSAWSTVLPYENSGTPVFDRALARIADTRQTWLAGDSRLGAVIMKSVG